MLEIKNLVVHYGAIQALEGISLRVNEGEIVCLIGANGAGKSTVLNAISGVIPVTSGSIELGGTAMVGRKPGVVVRSGLVQVPEGRRVFPDMSVLENLEMGAYTRKDPIGPTMDMVMGLFPILSDRRAQLAGLLSGGQQQMLAIGRALMAKPTFLLLDEPSMGLAPLVVADIFRTLARLRREFKLSILLVEQNAKAALTLADRGYVLTNGRITQSGTSKELLSDEATQEAFLGRRHAVQA